MQKPIVFKHKSERYYDERGYFHTMYDEDDIEFNDWKQENKSFSHAGVLRGLHYQNPFNQRKFVEVPFGKILAFCIDLRKQSNTFGETFHAILSSDNDMLMYVPNGFCFGFLAIEDSYVIYKCSEKYYPGTEHQINYKSLKIDLSEYYPIEKIIVSEKDLNSPMFNVNVDYGL